MKRLTALLLIICTSALMLCSCAEKNKNSDLTSSEGKRDKSRQISVEDINNSRPLWEALLYAEHFTGKTDNTDPLFRAYAYAYVLTYYGYGTQSNEHSDTGCDSVSASYDEMCVLTCALFGREAVFSDEDAEGLFTADGSVYTLKTPLEHIDGEYNMQGIGMRCETGFTVLVTDKREGMQVLFEKADEDFPYAVYITIADSDAD